MNTKNEVIICDKGYEVLGIQPVFLDTQDLTSFKNQRTPKLKAQPSWYDYISKYTNNNFYIFECILRDDLHYINYNEDKVTKYQIEVFVGKNISLNQAVIIYELKHLDGDHEFYSLNEFRDCLMAKDFGRTSIYKSSISKKIYDIRDCALRYIKFDLGLTSATIEADTCNLTMFYTALKPTLSFIDDVERVKTERDEISISIYTKLYSGGRFHLVASDYSDEKELIKFMLFKLQLTWFYIPMYSNVAMSHFQKKRYEKKAIFSYRKEASTVIKIYRIVKIQNELSKITLEALQMTYEVCQRRWGVEKIITALGEFAEYFMEQSEADYRQVQQHKSNILNYTLGILAFIGLASFPADFLTTIFYAKKYKSSVFFWQSMLKPPLAWMSWMVLCILGVSLILLITTLLLAFRDRG